MTCAALGAEAHFLGLVIGDGAASWSHTNLRNLARIESPEALLGRHEWLLRADVNRQWAAWAVDSVGDPERYSRRNSSYAEIFADVFQVIGTGPLQIGESGRKQLAQAAARIVFIRAQELRARRRQLVSDSARRNLLDLAGKTPRCWICGTAFSEGAVDNFLGRERDTLPLPQFLDILKPRGLFQRDVSIEIDHVVPHSRGGDERDNLALACGWCNRWKSAYSSVYDVEGRARRPRNNRTTTYSLPQPFWTVRLLATVRSCQHHEGCQRSTGSAPMTVAPIAQTGAMNPVNLRVTCYEHDTYESDRLWPRVIVQEVWNARKVVNAS